MRSPPQTRPLRRDTTSTQLGMRCFGWAMARLLGEQISQKIDLELKTLEGQAVSLLAWQKLSAKIKLVLESMPCIELMQAKRTVAVYYRGTEVKVTVSSCHQEAELKFMSMCKEWGLANATLEPLGPEDELLPPAKPVLAKVNPSS